jgi:hypothetical protein
VFTAQYELGLRFVFKGLTYVCSNAESKYTENQFVTRGVIRRLSKTEPSILLLHIIIKYGHQQDPSVNLCLSEFEVIYCYKGDAAHVLSGTLDFETFGSMETPAVTKLSFTAHKVQSLRACGPQS